MTFTYSLKISSSLRHLYNKGDLLPLRDIVILFEYLSYLTIIFEISDNDLAIHPLLDASLGILKDCASLGPELLLSEATSTDSCSWKQKLLFRHSLKLSLMKE